MGFLRDWIDDLDRNAKSSITSAAMVGITAIVVLGICMASCVHCQDESRKFIGDCIKHGASPEACTNAARRANGE